MVSGFSGMLVAYGDRDVCWCASVNFREVRCAMDREGAVADGCSYVGKVGSGQS